MNGLHIISKFYEKKKLFKIIFAGLLSISKLGNNKLFSSSQEKVSFTVYGAVPPIVSGSCILAKIDKYKILIDCGLFYEHEDNTDNQTLQFDPKELTHVLLTHAHIDHLGRIPLLYERGFKGKVITTKPTYDLAKIMIPSSYNIGRYQNSQIYSKEAYKKCLNSFKIIEQDSIIELSDEIKIEFTNAGHILGSSIILLYYMNKCFTFGFDIGQFQSIFYNEPKILEKSDVLFLEATYGAYNKVSIDYSFASNSIMNTINDGGSILFPAFTLEKTQKLLYLIKQMKINKQISSDIPVVLDSETSRKINKIYLNYANPSNGNTSNYMKLHGNLFSFPNLREMKGRKSMRQHYKNVCIYISSDGMLERGNSPKHLFYLLEDERNKIIITSYVSENSLASKLIEGSEEVEVPKEKYTKSGVETIYYSKAVKAKVEKWNFMSSHASGEELIDWISKFKSIGKVILVHGDEVNANSLRDRFINKHIDCEIGKLNHTYEYSI